MVGKLLSLLAVVTLLVRLVSPSPAAATVGSLAAEDSTPPSSSTIDSPGADVDSLPNSISLSGTATDEYAIEGVRIAVLNRDTLQWLQTDDSFGTAAQFRDVPVDAPGRISSNWAWKAPALRNGNYLVLVRARDSNGNQQATYSRRFITIESSPTWLNGQLSASNVTGSELDLEWSGSVDDTGVVAHNVIRDGVLIQTVPMPETFTTVTGLSDATTYTFEVQAVDAVGNVSFDGPKEVTTTLDVTEPDWTGTSLVTSGVTASEITLVWTAPTDNDAIATYRIFQDAVEVGEVDAPATTFTATGLNDVTTYRFTIEALDVTGNETSDGPSITERTIDITRPSWHEGAISVGHATSTSLAVSWSGDQDAAGVVTYELFVDGESIGSVDNNDFIVTGLSPDTLYELSVEAADLVGNQSIDGPSLTVSTLPDTEDPEWANPTLTVSGVGAFTIDIEWSGADDNIAITDYQVFQDGALVATMPVGTTTYSAVGLTNGTDVEFEVQAVDAAGNISTTGPTRTFTTLVDDEPPTWPAGSLSAAGATGTDLMLEWNARAVDNTGVTGYQVFQDAGLIGTVSAPTDEGDTLTFAVTGLKPRTSYTFALQAVDAWSNVSTDGPTISTNSGEDIEAPKWVGGLTTANKTESTIDLSWSGAVDNVAIAGYRLFANGEELAVVWDPQRTSYSASGLTQSVRYRFNVQAFDAASNESVSGPSTDVTMLEQAAPYWAPGQLFTADPTEILFVGDAATEGSCLDGPDTYRDDLLHLLELKGYAVRPVGSRSADRWGFSHCYLVTAGRSHEAIGGADTQWMLEGGDGLPGTFSSRLESYDVPDVAIVYLGQNDKTPGAFSDNEDTVRSNVDTIANLNLIVDDLLARNPTMEVFVAQIPVPELWLASDDPRHVILVDQTLDLNTDIASMTSSRGINTVDFSVRLDAELPDAISADSIAAAILGVVAFDALTTADAVSLAREGITETTVDLHWDGAQDDGGVVGYRVMQDGIEIADVAGSSYTVSDLLAGSTHTFTIVAYDADSNQTSGPSVTVQTRSTGADAALPRLDTSETSQTKPRK